MAIKGEELENNTRWPQLVMRNHAISFEILAPPKGGPTMCQHMRLKEVDYTSSTGQGGARCGVETSPALRASLPSFYAARSGVRLPVNMAAADTVNGEGDGSIARPATDGVNDNAKAENEDKEDEKFAADEEMDNPQDTVEEECNDGKENEKRQSIPQDIQKERRKVRTWKV